MKQDIKKQVLEAISIRIADGGITKEEIDGAVEKGLKDKEKHEIPFVAFSNNELTEQIPGNHLIQCPSPDCKKRHKIKYGKDVKTGKESKALGFVHCGKSGYLVAVNGKLVK